MLEIRFLSLFLSSSSAMATVTPQPKGDGDADALAVARRAQIIRSLTIASAFNCTSWFLMIPVSGFAESGLYP